MNKKEFGKVLVDMFSNPKNNGCRIAPFNFNISKKEVSNNMNKLWLSYKDYMYKEDFDLLKREVLLSHDLHRYGSFKQEVT